ncbi:hypothetical protein GCM10027566_30160 [Arachidicoccus ginsenosidivorans]|jgi:hypothetical protein|uniref:Uncharacterized protein n=1 Tax=Arachidicoccus ginsenosidivorans TaxID=496057 RepID=A0A5B8VR71_9BACT|nr:hypothetical protein [Arachidicoccus ginsenosidivorans]QEC72768.1 hypothetical protein FSB73_14885 [Arachidicoccus ginsenosidivorans]
MKSQLLLSYRYKKIGWILLLPCLVLGLLKWYIINDHQFLSYVMNVFYENVYFDIVPTLLIAGMLAGALLIVFSKEKQEDEFIEKLRLSSSMWAILVNYLILFFCNLLFYSWSFLNIIAVNMFTILFFYIIRFNYLLIRSKRS